MSTSIHYPFEQVQRHAAGVPAAIGAATPAAASSGSPFTLDPNDSSVDVIGIGVPWTRRIPKRWLSMAACLVVGLAIGLVLLVAMTLSRTEHVAQAAGAGAAGTVNDAVVHLHAAHIDKTCWQGIAPTESPARLTVSMAIAVDGKIRSAVAAGGSATMRSCVESYVKTWEFLPQAEPQAMVVPVEVAR